MKELSTEEKIKRYDDVVNKLKRFMMQGVDPLITRADVQDFFPELKECEDERIRKSLLEYLHTLPNHYAHSGVCAPEWIAWLEKQKSVEEIVERYKNSWYNEEKIQGQIEGLSDDEKYQQGWHDALEKQSVQKPFDYENATIQQTDFVPKFAMEAIKKEKVDNVNKIEPKDYSSIDPHYFKPVDKVEPKFHEGEWITFYGGELFKILKIEAELNGILDYLLLDQNGHDSYYNKKYVDENARLWTIQDAKNGDVLQLGEVTAIFKKFIGNKNCICYCSICEGEFEIPNQDGDDNNYGCFDATPATKEQRDRLFSKMKEAGYEWDADKKELKKIEESKLTEFEDAIKDMMDDYRDAIDDNDATVEEVKEKAAYLLSLIPCKPAEWSEKDDEMLDSIIEEVRYIGDFPDYPTKEENELYDDCLAKEEWLKSLKDRFTWKPSDKQIEALESASDELEKAATQYGIDEFPSLCNGCKHVPVDAFKAGAKWQKEHLWKPADGEDLPEIDREVIALLDNGKVVFAHRPDPKGWDGKNIITEKVEHYTPKTYDKGGWNQPDVKWWLDCLILIKEYE